MSCAKAHRGAPPCTVPGGRPPIHSPLSRPSRRRPLLQRPSASRRRGRPFFDENWLLWQVTPPALAAQARSGGRLGRQSRAPLALVCVCVHPAFVSVAAREEF